MAIRVLICGWFIAVANCNICCYTNQYLLAQLNEDGENTWWFPERLSIPPHWTWNNAQLLTKKKLNEWQQNTLSPSSCDLFNKISFIKELKMCYCLQRWASHTPISTSNTYFYFTKQNQKYQLSRARVLSLYNYPCKCELMEDDSYFSIGNRGVLSKNELPLLKCLLGAPWMPKFLAMTCQFVEGTCIVINHLGIAKYFSKCEKVRGELKTPVYFLAVSARFSTKNSKESENMLRFMRRVAIATKGTAVLKIVEDDKENIEPILWDDVRCLGFQETSQYCASNAQKSKIMWFIRPREVTFPSSVKNKTIALYVDDDKDRMPQNECKIFGTCLHIPEEPSPFVWLEDTLKNIGEAYTVYPTTAEKSIETLWSRVTAVGLTNIERPGNPFLLRANTYPSLALCYNPDLHYFSTDSGWYRCPNYEVPCETSQPQNISCFIVDPYSGLKFIEDINSRYMIDTSDKNYAQSQPLLFDNLFPLPAIMPTPVP